MPVSAQIALLPVIPSSVSALDITTPSTAIVQGLWLMHAFVPLLGAAAIQSGTLPMPVSAFTAVLHLHNIQTAWTEARQR